jgi:hypothetical protein
MGGYSPPKLADDVWELYDTTADWSQARDLSAEMPDKLRELQDLFIIEAAKYDVFPLDDRRYERFNPAIAGRPDLAGARTSMTLHRGMTHLMENTVLNVKNRSHSITAELTVPEGGAEGVVLAQGGRFAGWALHVKDGRPRYTYNWFDSAYYTVTGEEALPTGTVNLRFHFDFDGGQPGSGGTGTLYVDDQKVAEGRIEKTVPFVFSADETMDIGGDSAMPVTEDYAEGEKNQFTGDIAWVRIDLEDDDVSHLEPEDSKYHRVMARQ